MNKNSFNSNHLDIDYDNPILQKGTISRGIYKGSGDGNEYAIKIISKDNIGKISLNQIDKLVNLANKGTLNSNIVRFYGYREENNQLFIYMEYLDGYKSINSLLDNEMMGQFTEFEMIYVVKQLINALLFLHDNGILHQDIFGDNILLNVSSGNIKLVDFCYSSLESSKYYMDDIINGQSVSKSNIKMATENCEASPLAICIKSDIWCIGNLLKLMSGNDYMNNDGLSNQIKLFIEKCLNLDPSICSKSIDLIKLELSNIDLFHSDISIGIHQSMALYLSNDSSLKVYPFSEPESIKSCIYEFPSNPFIKTGQYISSDVYNDQLLPNSIPQTVTLVYLKSFNHPLDPNSIPSSVTFLHLPSYNCPLDSNCLPSSLRYLILESYNHPITLNTFPESLTDLTLKSYSQRLNINCLNSSIKKLSLPLFIRNNFNNNDTEIINNNSSACNFNIINNSSNVINSNNLKNNNSSNSHSNKNSSGSSKNNSNNSNHSCENSKNISYNNNNNNSNDNNSEIVDKNNIDNKSPINNLNENQISDSEIIINSKYCDLSQLNIPTTIKTLILNHYNQPISESLSIPNIESLHLLSYNHPIEPNSIPKSIQSLFLESFDQIISPNTMPSSISKLVMKSFNKPLSISSLPDSIEHLELASFNQPILQNTLPRYLKTLILSSFNQTIEFNSISKTISKLSLQSFDQPISLISLPDSVVELQLEQFNQILYPDTLPISITSLALKSFNQKLLYKSLPNSIKYLILESYNHKFDKNIIPSSITSLKLSKFNKYILPNSLPFSIKYLELESYSHQLELDTIPTSTIHLSLPSYNHKLDKNSIPKAVQHLELLSYNNDLDEYSISESIQVLVFGENFDFNLYGGNLPDSILEFRCDFQFNKPLKKQNNIPKKVKILQLNNYNQKIISSSLPNTIHTLTLGSKFTHFESLSNLPPSIVNLTFGIICDTNLDSIKSYIPKTITNITIHKQPNNNNNN